LSSTIVKLLGGRFLHTISTRPAPVPHPPCRTISGAEEEVLDAALDVEPALA
jgi:hypothetical protein